VTTKLEVNLNHQRKSHEDHDFTNERLGWFQQTRRFEEYGTVIREGGEKHVLQAITRKPCAKLINKLSSNVKSRLKPVLKDLVINVDKNESEDEDSSKVNRSRYTWLTNRNIGKLHQVGARF
jgi:hypothetical protein